MSDKFAERNELIRYYFEDLGLSTKEIAGIIGKSQRTIQDIILKNKFQKGKINQEELDNYIKTKPTSELFNFYIYSLNFGNDYIYIGVTSDIERRMDKHRSDVANKTHYCELFNIHPDIEKILNEVNILKFLYQVPKTIAFKYERYYQELYKSKGYKLLSEK